MPCESLRNSRAFRHISAGVPQRALELSRKYSAMILGVLVGPPDRGQVPELNLRRLFLRDNAIRVFGLDGGA